MEGLESLEWMCWTPPTLYFFSFIFLSLIFLWVLEIRRPTVKRKGFLPLKTTRGDRFFISLLSTAFIHLLWVGLTDSGPWWGTGISSLLFIITMRWG